MIKFLYSAAESLWWRVYRKRVLDAIQYSEKIETLEQLDFDTAKNQALGLIQNAPTVRGFQSNIPWDVQDLPCAPPHCLKELFDRFSAIEIDEDYRISREDITVAEDDQNIMVIGQDPQIELLGFRNLSAGELESYSFEDCEWAVSYPSVYHWIIITHFASNS